MEQFIFAFYMLVSFLEKLVEGVSVLVVFLVWAILIFGVICGKKWRWYTKVGVLLLHGYFVSLVRASMSLGYYETGVIAILAAIFILLYGLWVNGIPDFTRKCLSTDKTGEGS